MTAQRAGAGAAAPASVLRQTRDREAVREAVHDRGRNGQARRATLRVRLGSLRNNRPTIPRPSARAPAWMAEAATRRAAQNESGEASTPACACPSPEPRPR